jgi:Ala-tRNA(Pro) deacylase
MAECRERLESYLNENNAPFQVQRHALAYTAQEVAASEHVPGKMVAKVVIVIADGRMAMIVLPAPYTVDTGRAAWVLKAKEVRLAREDEFRDAFPDCEVGAMPPFGNLYDVPVYVDKALAEDETIVFRAGSHTETMSVKYADFHRLVQPKVGEFAREHDLSEVT